MLAQIPEQWVDNMITWEDWTKVDQSDDGFDPKKYSVLAVWPAIVVQQEDLDDVQDFFSAMGCKNPIVPVGVVYTLPDYGDRLVHPEEGELPTGGRPDFCFYFHNEDIPYVAVRRLQHGIRWWEDVVSNEQMHAEEEGLPYEEYSIYPDSFREYFGDSGYIGGRAALPSLLEEEE